MNEAGPLLKVEGIAKSFGSVPVLQSVELTVKKGQILDFIGPNGSGKSTLFNIVTGFECADAGMAYFADARIDGLRPDVIARRGLMRTFQLSEGGLRLTALENLLAAPTDQNEPRLFDALPRRVIARETVNIDRARTVLDLLGLKQAANEYLGNLSGGNVS
jgi:neutral amino acid transport system ATP-binding protein